MYIRQIGSTEEFAALRSDWERLHAESGNHSIFTTWEWQYHWWKHYGKGLPLRLLALTEDDRLVGLLPLYIQTVPHALGWDARILRFVGTGGDTTPDYLDALLAKDHATDAAPFLAQHVVAQLDGWDIVWATDMDEGSLFRRALAQACNARGLARQEGVSARISYIPLPASWADYLGSLHRDRRYTIRSNRRKFDNQPGTRFFVWQDPDSIDRAIDRLVKLHHLRWRDRATEHAFSSPEYLGFHRDVIRACMEKDWLRMYCLEVLGAVVAVYYCYRFRNSVFYFQGGFDPQYERLSPGLCLMGYAIEHAITEGNHVFDMLRGEYDYKRQWAKSVRETYYVVGYRNTFRARWHRFSQAPARLRGAIGQWVKRFATRSSNTVKAGDKNA